MRIGCKEHYSAIFYLNHANSFTYMIQQVIVNSILYSCSTYLNCKYNLYSLDTSRSASIAKGVIIGISVNYIICRILKIT